MNDNEEDRTSRRLTAVEEAIWGRYHGNRDAGLLNKVNYLTRRVDALESPAPKRNEMPAPAPKVGQVWRGGLPSLNPEGLAKLDADIRRLVSKEADLDVYVAGRLLGLQQAREWLVKEDGK